MIEWLNVNEAGNHDWFKTFIFQTIGMQIFYQRRAAKIPGEAEAPLFKLASALQGFPCDEPRKMPTLNDAA
jgi:hypothetical protein